MIFASFLVYGITSGKRAANTAKTSQFKWSGRYSCALSIVLGLGLGGCENTANQKSAAQVTSQAPIKVAVQKISFNDTIQPILSENCYSCHGPDPSARKASLRLDRPEGAFNPHGKSTAAIVKGNPDKSPLIQRIESKIEKEVMPPADQHKTLKASDIALLRRWISEGAQYEEHWAFITPKRPAVPTAYLLPSANPIDAFIRQRLVKENLQPSPEADRRSLIRRVSLDLTGMIPSELEVNEFLTDQSPNAYERVVDRLLASTAYGEHRARYWLDYARYADTHGIHFDNMRAISPYRDYVIRAFNSNKPFDVFVREQLAGDLLPARNFDQLAATGFVRCNLTTNEGGDIPEETYVNQTRDRVEAFGAAFLGLTTGCAACHDHKYDPFTQKDFYSLAAILGNTAEKPWDDNIADPRPVLKFPKVANKAGAEFIFTEGAELKAQLMKRKEKWAELMTTWLAQGNKPKAVSEDKLEMRLRLDEGHGDVVKNSAPGAVLKEFKADTNPLVWGENSWLWPSMRMDINTRLSLGDVGNVDTDNAFSVGGWLMLRLQVANGNTGSGTLIARMGDEKDGGWSIYHDKGFITVSLLAADHTTKADTKMPGAKMSAPNKHGIIVTTSTGIKRDEWVHLFVTYSGNGKASGVRTYINGKLTETPVTQDTLDKKDSIKTVAQTYLGSKESGSPMKATRFQDIRLYKRALTADEVARLLFEDRAAEIVASKPNLNSWTSSEKFIAVNKYFFSKVDQEAIDLANAVTQHDEAFDALTRDGPATLVAVEKETPPAADLLKRGDYFSRVGRVEGAPPHFLPEAKTDTPMNRKGLAEWLLSPNQPLMGRVTVNRMWQEIFGRGLVESSGDFGVMGAKPSHPELLDYLTIDFRENNWDVKRLYKLIVMSETYKQSANLTADSLAKDPSNRYLARGPRFRMDAEMLRDSALKASGLLVAKLGGPSVKPYQPPGLWEEVAMPESNTKTYVPDTGEGLYRRSLYTFWKRGSMPPAMETFDATSRETVCTRRAHTNTPLQAFVTMNDPQWVEAARKLAERTLIEAKPTDVERINFIAETTLNRPLTQTEALYLQKSAATFKAHFINDEDSAKALISVGASPYNQSLKPKEIAEWTLVASEFLNLDEFLTK